MSSHAFFALVELILIGSHYAFPELPHQLGIMMFWAGILGLVGYPGFQIWKHRRAIRARVESSHVIIGCLLGAAVLLIVAAITYAVRTPATASQHSTAFPPPHTQPVLKRPYSGESKTTLDKDLSFISAQLNGPGLAAVSKANKIANNISVVLVAVNWQRYEPIKPVLEEVMKDLDQLHAALIQRISEHPFQAEDLRAGGAAPANSAPAMPGSPLQIFCEGR